MADLEMIDLAETVLATCRARGWRIGTVESCTGGLIAGALTAVAGSSDVVECGFVTYSNEAKIELVGVPPPLFPTVGAVSAEVAAAMAEGLLARVRPVHLAVSTTGIAGPAGGTKTKPVGLVYFGLATRNYPTETVRDIFPGDRDAIRRAAVLKALRLLRDSARS